MASLDVSIAFIKQNDTYILQRRSVEPEKGAAGLIGAFGGKIEADESPIEAVCRELGEETSLRPSPEDFEYVGAVEVITDRDLAEIHVKAYVFRLVISTEQAVEAQEGEIVTLTHQDALERYHPELTPATRAAFEQMI